HGAAHAQAEHRERNQHDREQPGHDAGPEAHGALTRMVPSHSTVSRAAPRRTIACARVSTSGTSVAAYPRGTRSRAAPQGSSTRAGRAATSAHSPPARSAASNSSGPNAV